MTASAARTFATLPSLADLRRKPRITALTAAAAVAAVLWTAAHTVPGFAPAVADGLRAAIGNDGVAWLEDTVYSARDSVNQVVRSGEAPRAVWGAPLGGVGRGSVSAAAKGAVESARGASTVAPMPRFAPAEANVPFPEVAASGDGQWLPVEGQTGAPMMFKTMLHPDPARTWAELFVVALDVSAIDVHLVAGRREPLSEVKGSETYGREAKIPSTEYSRLLAAFNGGFKTTHGHFGARVDGVTLVSPKKHSCTVGQRADGSLALGTWKELREQDDFVWLRQTPGCMVEGGELHPGLSRDDNTNWGATLDGGTVIRRSAIGLSEDGQTLYVGISNDTTARALALGMQSAGARHVAQLDVNHSYPRFMLYDRAADGAPEPRSLVDGFVVHDKQYLRPEGRDFFYVTEKTPRWAAAQTPSTPSAG